jgi:hypothetical protein
MTLERLFIISWAISAISLATQMLLSYLLFRTLKKRHTSYYKTIGEPSVIVTGRLRDTEEEVRSNYIRALKGAVFAYWMVLKGLPKDFPNNDIRLRKLAQVIRIVTTSTVISFTVFLIVTYFFYRSGL